MTKRLLQFTLLAILCGITGRLAAQTVNTNWQNGTNSSATNVVTISPTSGHWVIALGCTTGTWAATPVSDSASSGYTKDGIVTLTGVSCVAVHSTSTVGAGITTVTFTATGSTSFVGGVVLDVSGLVASPFDCISTTFTTGSGAFNTNNCATGNATDLLLGMGESDDSGALGVTQGSSFSTIVTTTTFAETMTAAERSVTSTASYQWTGTTSGGNLYSGLVVAYKGSNATGGSVSF